MIDVCKGPMLKGNCILITLQGLIIMYYSRVIERYYDLIE